MDAILTEERLFHFEVFGKQTGSNLRAREEGWVENGSHFAPCFVVPIHTQWVSKGHMVATMPGYDGKQRYSTKILGPMPYFPLHSMGTLHK